MVGGLQGPQGPSGNTYHAAGCVFTLGGGCDAALSSQLVGKESQRVTAIALMESGLCARPAGRRFAQFSLPLSPGGGAITTCLRDICMSVSRMTRRLCNWPPAVALGSQGSKLAPDPHSSPPGFLVQRIKTKQLPSRTPQTNLDVSSCFLAEWTPLSSPKATVAYLCSQIIGRRWECLRFSSSNDAANNPQISVVS